jgi:hypothetical protein
VRGYDSYRYRGVYVRAGSLGPRRLLHPRQDLVDLGDVLIQELLELHGNRQAAVMVGASEVTYRLELDGELLVAALLDARLMVLAELDANVLGLLLCSAVQCEPRLDRRSVSWLATTQTPARECDKLGHVDLERPVVVLLRRHPGDLGRVHRRLGVLQVLLPCA